MAAGASGGWVHALAGPEERLGTLQGKCCIVALVNTRIKLRLAALGLALGLLGALIVGVTLTSQQRGEETRARLGQVDMESMRISDRFKDKRSEERRVG